MAAPPPRSTLLRLLSEACELEHGLACSYLYAAFSLKSDLAEGGLTWQELQLVRKWAAQVFFVASEEMLHLAQAWNLLAAVGGTPYYLRPNFPQPARYYPLDLPLLLEPFGTKALERFVVYERPRELAQQSVSEDYRTVGYLYELIRGLIEAWPERDLFIGLPNNQVGPELVDFPDLIKVVGRESAIHAIDMITEQGEGASLNTIDCHFGVFTTTLAEFQTHAATARETGGNFVPARPAMVNPTTRHRGPMGITGASVIGDPFAREVAELFDEVYGLMLRMLQYVFDDFTVPTAYARALADGALLLMVRVIKPLGEALTCLPADASGQVSAGPGFGVGRHVPLPRDESACRVIVRESLHEMSSALAALASRQAAPRGLRYASDKLSALSEHVRESTTAVHTSIR